MFTVELNTPKAIETYFKLTIHPYQSIFKIHQQPTCNCQLSAIGNAYAIFNNWNAKYSLEILLEAYKIIDFHPKLVIIDIFQSLCPKVEQSCTVHSKTPYDNSNGTKMCLYIVELKKPEVQS